MILKINLILLLFNFLIEIIKGQIYPHPFQNGLLDTSVLINYSKLVSGPDGKCNFEKTCNWQWSEKYFSNVTSVEIGEKIPIIKKLKYFPRTDANGSETGHFLFSYTLEPRKVGINLTSPEINPDHFDKSQDQPCALSFSLNSNIVPFSNISVLIDEQGRTKVIDKQISSDIAGRWQTKKILIGRPEGNFRIVIEIGEISTVPSFLAIDNLELEKCYPDVTFGRECSNGNFRCKKDDLCIPSDMVCDIRRDCADSSDETEECNEIPSGSRCTFENGWCGWNNVSDKQYGIIWKLNRGRAGIYNTGPTVDNTYGNITGKYAYVDMSTGSLGSLALMESAELNPPPPVHGDPYSSYYNSCHVTFFYHKYGQHSGSLGLYIQEMKMGSYKPQQRLWWSYGNKGDMWLRQVVVLPNITDRYKIQFEARKSMSPRGDVAIDDISFSPKCFGKGIPKDLLGDYDYYEYPKKYTGIMNTHRDFGNLPSMLTFTTCGAKGADGPTRGHCEFAYGNKSKIMVLEAQDRKGIQKWIVPESNFYTVIAKGARGGKGADGLGESKATIVTAVTELHKNQDIYVLVGQEGHDACKKLGFDNAACLVDMHFRTKNYKSSYFQEYRLQNGGGGGGGGTFVFTLDRSGKPNAIVVAAGGGGLAHGPFLDDDRQHGHGINHTLPNITGPAFGKYPAGAGGGWEPGNMTYVSNSSGYALTMGGRGGPPCYLIDQTKGFGGFGGGGGGCVAGGGGGGYTGGRAWTDSHINGEGGWSMVTEKALYKNIQTGAHYGPGSVLIIPAIVGCGCEYRCIALDELRSVTRCICSTGWDLKPDNKSCSATVVTNSIGALWFGISILLVFCIIFMIITFILYNRYMVQKTELTKRKICGTNPNNGVNSVRLTEFNPNYEFGGVKYTIRDLKEIRRDRVQLVKPLGSGAFGDVYQGLLRQRSTDSVELAVAVKILPALCSNEAENDFLMEALIMSKFNHPNIVHFIGACFDTHPRYIILELLAGGDLKKFLRENRPKVDKPSALRMKDLLQCAIDVAKGCQYLEENHFVHRDIAARNCLLSSPGPGRVVKIADFGMSRDIYRSDYYKKGGKAMLPVKWMPPESFLDGIFTTKTDVWSYGVLLWEIMSLGFLPYTGIRNREVMNFVTRGARLGAPSNCPTQVFAIMGMCWSQDANERPNFATILERLGYCMEDPEVLSTPLPVYKGPILTDLDHHVIRPPNSESESGLDFSQEDYVEPIVPDFVWKEKELDILNRYVADGRFPNSPPAEPPKSTNNEAPETPMTDMTTLSPDDSTRQPEITENGPFILSGQYVADTRV